MFKKWDQGGRQGSGVNVIQGNITLAREVPFGNQLNEILGYTDTLPRPLLQVVSPDAYISNINLDADEERTIAIEFSEGPTPSISTQNENTYKWYVAQHSVPPSETEFKLNGRPEF